MMLPREGRPPTKRRVDYRPPAFLVDTVQLAFDLDPEATEVTTTLAFRRNPEAAAQDREAPLVLDGEQQDEVDVAIDGLPLPPSRMRITPTQMTIVDPPASGVLTISSTIAPARNVALEGLYLSSGVFCSQCEPEGFRRITYFPDRPDVLAKFTVTLRADRARYPVLLSNGNRIDAGPLDDGRHFATCHDPFRKPS
jgi:aminopeptidase N